jgi:hypothetical protein
MKRLGTFVIAAATLMLETALTRVFALSHGHHFAFMAISIALLGLGAGGLLLTLWPVSQQRRYVEGVMTLASIGFVATTLGSYVFLNLYPFDIYRIAWERIQVLYLMANYLALTLPFFCSGVVVGLALEIEEAGNVTYAANLLGSASGCLIALIALSLWGGAGTVALSAACGCIAAGMFGCRNWRDWRRGSVLILLVSSFCALVPLIIVWLGPPWFQVHLSPYQSLSYALQFPGSRVLSSRWNAFSRVDVVESDAIHVSPGLSLGYTGDSPLQHGLYVDARAQAAMISQDTETIQDWAAHLPLALVYRLQPQARVLVLEPGGGLDVAVARSQGAAQVTAVSSNSLVVDAVRRYGSGLYANEDVSVVVQAPRSYVRGHRGADGARFSVIDLALNDAQRAVVSGGYALSEDYRYTVQAFTDYLSMLQPGGMLVVQRWLQMPPSESLRAWALAVTTLERDGHVPSQDSLIAIRSWSTMLILIKKGAFVASELDLVRQFCVERQFDLVYLSDLKAEEANRYHFYEEAPYYHAFRELFYADRREKFYREWAYDTRPPTDDKPFYFHLFKWRQVPDIWQQLGHTWQPFGGGGYLVLLALLGIATLASGVTILFPLAFTRRSPGVISGLPRGPALTYFGCLGLAYLGIEIPLIQRCVLFVDHPTTAFATVVSVLLIASGIGSLLATRLRVQWAIPTLVIYVLFLAASLSVISDLFLGRSLAVRITVVSVLLTPLGVFMGVPFPAGLALLYKGAPKLIPWAWSINGCASVIASILTALTALSWGFNVVLFISAIVYLLAWGIWMTLIGATVRNGFAPDDKS